MGDLNTKEPVACTLTNESQRAETQQFRIEMLKHVLEREKLVNGAKITFANKGDIQESIERLIKLDKGCCTFLDHKIDVFEDTISLTVTGQEKGVAQAQGFLDALGEKNGQC